MPAVGRFSGTAEIRVYAGLHINTYLGYTRHYDHDDVVGGRPLEAERTAAQTSPGCDAISR
jgi:hypothetical protein